MVHELDDADLDILHQLRVVLLHQQNSKYHSIQPTTKKSRSNRLL
jgi:hypothetical protein